MAVLCQDYCRIERVRGPCHAANEYQRQTKHNSIAARLGGFERSSAAAVAHVRGGHGCHSKLEDAAFQSKRYRMRSAARSKLRKNAGNVTFHCVFIDLQDSADAFVGVAGGDKLEHLHLAASQERLAR